MNVELAKVSEEEKEILFNLLQSYLKEFDDILHFETDEKGVYKYKFFDLYWIEHNRIPLFIKTDSKIVGFALVNLDGIFSDTPGVHTISEFFVEKEFRKKGIGERAAEKVFEMFPGNWEIRQRDKNTGAIEFWRKVIKGYTKGSFREEILNDERWRGLSQTFSAPDRIRTGDLLDENQIS